MTAHDLANCLEYMHEYDGPTFGWQARGHYDLYMFVEAITIFEGAVTTHPTPRVSAVRTTYMRMVPFREGGWFLIETPHRGPGAFPVTICEFDDCKD